MKKSVQLDGVAQHPGTLAFGGDGAGRTAEVQVHLGVAKAAQLADHINEHWTSDDTEYGQLKWIQKHLK